MKNSKFSNNFSMFLKNNATLVTLFVVVLVLSVAIPNFTKSRNLTAIMFQSVVTGFLALGQLLVIITGGIDLSQGAVVALTSIVVSLTIGQYGLIIGILSGILAGTLMGLFSGILVAKTKIPPFIVTLGAMGVARGLAMMLAGSKPVPIDDPIFKLIGAARISWVPLSSILLLISAGIIGFFLSARKTGKYIYAVGSSESSSNLSGINVSKIKLLVYLLSGFFCAFGGIVWCSRLVSGSPVGGYGYETESIAAVVVGGASLSGGEGNVMGAISGVLIFQCIYSVLNLQGINPFWQGAFKGLLIIFTVILGAFRSGQIGRKKEVAAV